MRTGKAGLDHIKEFEGLSLKDYDDGTGVRTVGYGHTSSAGPPAVTKGMTITKQKAEDILQSDLHEVENDVTRLVTAPINQNQFDAFVSFHFNTGGLGRSSALKYFNAGNSKEVPSLLLMWNKAGGKVLPGLIRRRKAEGALFMSPFRDAAPPPPDIPKPEAPIPQYNTLHAIIDFVIALFKRK